MITATAAFYALGVIVFAAAAVLAVTAIVCDVRRHLSKILAALRGKPFPPAASVAPHATAPLPQLRGVEAAAEPAIEVRA